MIIREDGLAEDVQEPPDPPMLGRFKKCGWPGCRTKIFWKYRFCGFHSEPFSSENPLKKDTQNEKNADAV